MNDTEKQTPIPAVDPPGQAGMTMTAEALAGMTEREINESWDLVKELLGRL